MFSSPIRSTLVSAACILAGTLPLASPAAATVTNSQGLVTTEWACTNGDLLTFALPAAASSPSAGSTVAPFPGILVNAQPADGQPAPPLGTYVVLGAVDANGVTSVGQKTGLSRATLTCTLVGTPVTVVIAHAGR